jgi:ElaB/YqjD/DUF883 family membrane-anchored ribosome-binding protein
MEVFLAILAAIGISFAAEGASDVVQGIGRFASSKWRSYISQINSVINQNSQKLSDWKTLNETQKQNLINSLITSSGLGTRAAAIRKEYQNLVAKDKEYTNKVTKANAEAQNQATEAERYVQASGTGLIGAAEAAIRAEEGAYPNKASQYVVTIPEQQNVEGGLKTNERN